MKQIIILTMLALTIDCTYMSAQTQNLPISQKESLQMNKERKKGEDGFIWYLVNNGELWGAYDIEGKEIVPMKYSTVKYITNKNYHYFEIEKDDFKGIYTRLGKCVISTDKHYTGIELQSMYYGGLWIAWQVERNGGLKGLLDAKGNEIVETKYDDIRIQNGVYSTLYWKDYEAPRFIYIESNGRIGCVNLNGEIMLPLGEYDQYDVWGVTRDDDGYCYFYYGSPGNSKTKKLVNCDVSVPNNYLPYDDIVYGKKSSLGSSPSSSLNSSASSSSSSSSYNTSSSGSSTTTVVVEQHGPVQVWVACGACGHNPGVCQTCVGMGTSASGRTCISCHGTGKCHFCNGQGGRYQVEYR